MSDDARIHIVIILTPLSVSMSLYTTVTFLSFLEYYITLSYHKLLPNLQTQQRIHNSSNSRMTELDDSLSRARNISGSSTMARTPKRDIHSNSLDLSEAGNVQPQQVPVKSSGEENRIQFYKCLSISLLLRIFFLPLERKYSYSEDDITEMIVSSSLPTLTWMISFALLTCFYAQMTFMALVKVNQNNILNSFRKLVLPIMFGLYGCIIFFNRVLPIIPNKWFEILIWGIMAIFNLFLLFSMSYFGYSLSTILKSNMNGTLGLKLVSTSIICAVTFSLRSVVEIIKVVNVIHGSKVLMIPIWLHQPVWDSVFGRNVLGYIVLELLPSTLVLALMHKPYGIDTTTTNNTNSTNNLRQNHVIHEESPNSLEGGEISSNTLDQPQQQGMPIFMESKTKQGTIFAKRSIPPNNSLNIPISVTSRTMLQQQSLPRPRVTSAGTGRTVSGAKGMGEKSSLIEKSNSAVASTTYGT